MTTPDTVASGHGDELVVVVTGASRGIGLAVARRFAEEGARVAMIARDRVALETARQRLPGITCAVAADVSDHEALQRAIDEATTVLGPPAVLVNNAGAGLWGAVLDIDVEDVRRTMEVNYLGAVNAIGIVLPGMVRRRRGHVVNVASVAGRIGAPFEAAYSASKFALVGYSEALAIELAGTGVTVSLVEAGPVDTAFYELRRHAYDHRLPRQVTPDRVAAAVVRSARSRRSSEVFVPRWLRLAHQVKTLLPPAHRAGTKLMFSGERRTLRDRFR